MWNPHSPFPTWPKICQFWLGSCRIPSCHCRRPPNLLSHITPPPPPPSSQDRDPYGIFRRPVQSGRWHGPVAAAPATGWGRPAASGCLGRPPQASYCQREVGRTETGFPSHWWQKKLRSGLVLRPVQRYSWILEYFVGFWCWCCKCT